MESENYNKLIEVINKHAFSIHEEYIKYKHTTSYPIYYKNDWKMNHRHVWEEICNTTRELKIDEFEMTTVLDDLVKLKPGVGFMINGWI